MRTSGQLRFGGRRSANSIGPACERSSGQMRNSITIARLSHSCTITSPSASSSATRRRPRSSSSIAASTLARASSSPSSSCSRLLHSSSISARSACRPPKSALVASVAISADLRRRRDEHVGLELERRPGLAADLPAAADQLDAAVAAQQQLLRAQAAVVGEAHREAVRARVVDQQQIADAQLGQLALDRELVVVLAQRADDIDALAAGLAEGTAP